MGYGSCLASPIVLVPINYFVHGTSAPCSFIDVVAPLTTGQIEVVDCNNNLLVATGARTFVNPDATCDCNLPVPVEETTWGRVKALYQ